MRKCIGAIALAALLAATLAAQDARTVISNASKAMGADGLNAVTFYGAGANFNLGQNNNSNAPWPRGNANDYVRTIDFTQPASRATWVTYAAPVTGGPAVQGNGQQNITPTNTAWAQQLEIWITPWGFLKGAAANNATVRSQNIGGRRFNVATFNAPVKSPGGQPYKVVGYIGPQGLVERVQTWVENPIFGDMLVEAEYTNYRDANGLMFPAEWVQKRGGHPFFELQILGANANPRNLAQLMTVPPPAGGGAAPAAAAARRLLPPRPRRNWLTASSGSTAPTTRWPWSSRITSSSSSPARRTKRARWRSSPRRRGSSRTSRSATA